MDGADHTQGANCPIGAQCDVVNASTSLEDKRRGSDCRARREGPLQQPLKFRACAAVWPDNLIEIPHHDKTLRGGSCENFGETGQILFMVFPLHLAFQLASGLSP